MTKIKIGDCFENTETGKAWVFEKEEGGTMICSRDYKRICIGKAYMEPLQTLHLPIKGKWFEMILSGEKKEEYRDLKPFYCSRLGWVWNDQNGQWAVFTPRRDFKVIHLTHGYGHDKPQLWAYIKEITIGLGNPEWGAPAEDVFILKLGEVFHTKNLRQ